MKQVIEEMNATNRETHLLFVDLTTAYGSIPILKLREVSRELNINNLLTYPLHAAQSFLGS